MNQTSVIIASLRSAFNHKYALSNTFLFAWESDFVCFTMSDYCVEVEVKVSRADFLAHFNKKDKHYRLKNNKEEFINIPGNKEFTDIFSAEDQKMIDQGRSPWDFKPIHIAESIRIHQVKNIIPNRFYYCSPVGVIDKKDIPDYAGLLTYEPRENYDLHNIRTVKQAPMLHKRKMLDNMKPLLMHKFYHENNDLRREIAELRYSIKLITNVYKEPANPFNPNCDMYKDIKDVTDPKFIQGQIFE